MEMSTSPLDTANPGRSKVRTFVIVAGLASVARISKARSKTEKCAFIPLPVVS
jgi:hypothetical protein